MEEASENGKESPHSAHASGINESINQSINDVRGQFKNYVNVNLTKHSISGNCNVFFRQTIVFVMLVYRPCWFIDRAGT
jgi:hypothetical protein